jgi:asparagine synthase (glutamine-hydrolysing)
MCGIAGLVGRREPDRLSAMLRSIEHRGPDDVGQCWSETRFGWLGLGNRRLAVLDLSIAGHQPMESDGRILAYNGETYNFAKLRKELERAGETFRGGSDTEVVLALLNRDGVEGLRRLNAMFALAWWNAPEGELVIARDRFGIKPLYYCAPAPSEFAFASEAKCLFAAGIAAEFDVTNLPSYLTFGSLPGSATLFTGVRQLLPGQVLRYSASGTKIETFRPPSVHPDTSMTRRSAALEVRSALSDAVERQMVADVPVGVMLSGGLDSTAIAALAARSTSSKITAYSIAFRPEDAVLEQNASDSRFARFAADRLGLDLHEIEASPDVADMLERVAWHLDDPVADPAAIPTLLISEPAKRDVTVLLSGQGSDELFGGYRINSYNRWAEAIERQPRWLQQAEGSAIARLPAIAAKLPARAHPGLLLAVHRASQTVFDQLGETPENRYVGWRSAYQFPDGGLTSLLDRDTVRDLGDIHPTDEYLRLFGQHHELSFFDRMLLVDQATFLVGRNLAYSDRLSMAASIELRVPFLDDAVADVAARVPEHLKFRGMHLKAVLRDAMAGIVPDEIIKRRKAGFGLPVRSWLRGELMPLVNDTLSDTWLKEIGCFDAAAVRRLLEEHRAGTADHTWRIWTLLSLSLWWRAHIAQ